MKREAEQRIIADSDMLFTSIIRPGLVYHETERPWSVPMGLLSNLGHKLTGGQGPPGTNLRVLVDVIAREALHSNEDVSTSQANHRIVSARDMKTQFPL